MNWRITNRNTSDNYVVAEVIRHEEFTYKGFFKFSTFQPEGLGALYKNGILVKFGYWKNGELPQDSELPYGEYELKMNEYFNSR